jgi:hypothetical protein
MMKSTLIVCTILLSATFVSAQSLKPDDPFPLKEGINTGTSDSLVGTQYWYFYAAPGSSRVVVRLKKSTALYGAEMKTTLAVTMTDANRTWRSTKMLTANPNGAEVSFAADKVQKHQKIIVSVAPPNQNLIRMGGDYEIEVAGDVSFAEASVERDPVIGTYDSMVNSYGATRFLANGTILASDGSQGVWKLFDPENHIYTVVIGAYKASVQYRPGYGLVKPSEQNLIVFQEVRRRN